MNIGIDGHMIGDRSGGNESYSRGLFDAYAPRKEDNCFLFLRKGVSAEEYENKYVVRHFRFNNAIIRNLIELPILCLKYRLDLLQTQYYIPLIRPCKTYVMIYDICFEHLPKIFTVKEYIKNKVLIRYAAKKANCVLTISNFSKEDISKTYHIEEQRIRVIPAAVSTSFRKLTQNELEKSDIRKKYGIGDGKYLLCVGNLQPRKNLARLIDAYMESSIKGSVKLVIVGKKAWMYSDVLRKALADGQSIILTDYVTREDLVALLNEADGFVYPSLFEGFGLPPLEALVCGTKVAVSDIPVMHEVIGDGAVYFDPYRIEDIRRGIEKLLEASLPSEFNNPFSWERSAGLYDQALHERAME